MDLQGPFCRKLAPHLARLRKEYGDDVQVAIVHYPLTKLHPNAKRLARLAIAAHGQGRFWPVYDRLFSRRGKAITPAAMERWILKKSGSKRLDPKKFRRDYVAALRVIQRDQQLGRRLRIRGTPTTFINGWRVNGAVPFATLRTLVERELNKEQP